MKEKLYVALAKIVRRQRARLRRRQPDFPGSLAIAPAKNYFSEWRHYQHGYLRMIRNRSDANHAAASLSAGGIQQIWLPELGVVDRCTSCHVGLKEASLTDVSPAIPHASRHSAQARSVRLHDVPSRTGRRNHGRRSAQQHAGMGAADSSRAVHRVVLRGMSSRPLSRHSAAESGTSTAFSRRVRALPHREVAGRQDVMKATDDPPSLSHIADKTTREWIFAWLKDPQAYAALRPCRISS